tara:strand:- start:143 stop:589 length:447 start_codon:yes stop_codon:yes gene_type:complete
MLCPKCTFSGLVEVQPNLINLGHGTGVFNCEKCNGHWLNRESIETYLAKQDQVKVEAFRSVWHSSPQPSAARKCPHDQIRLGTITFKKIDLDVCPQCKGLWFDELELEVITNRNVPKGEKSGGGGSVGGGDCIDIVGEIFGAIFGGGW